MPFSSAIAFLQPKPLVRYLTKRMRKFLGLLLLLTACSSSNYRPYPAAPPPAPQMDLTAELLCQGFVQDFYDWYVKLWNADGGVQNISDVRALNLRPDSFSSDLTSRLMRDASMHRRNPGMMTLDGDPFLSGRYYAGSFTIAHITVEQDGHCFADMYDVEDPKSRVLVTPELEPVGDSWRFVNFHYPKHGNVQAGDILDTLEAFQEDRHKPTGQ